MRVKIAVVDSGIESFHPGIETVAGGVNLSLDEKGNVIHSDEYEDCGGHGTACAGIIRKKAPNAELYSIRIFDPSLTAHGDVLIAAIEWAIDNKMDVLNLSLGSTDVSYKDRLRDVCIRAVKAGLIIVAAEHNAGLECYPAVFPEVIGVGGGDIYHPDTYFYRDAQAIEFVARGNKQRLCWLDGKEIISDGTSFAAPHITGIIGRLLQENPGRSLSDIRQILIENAQKVPSDSQVVRSLQSQRSLDRDYSWVKRAVLYPYNKEMHSLVRYRDMLPFEIVTVVDPVAKGLVGKDAGVVIGEQPCGLRIQPNLYEALREGDTLILGYVDQLMRIQQRDLLKELIEMALEANLNIFSFQAVDPDRYRDLYQLAEQNNRSIAFPHIGFDEIVASQEAYDLYPNVDAPVVAVMGTSSQQGKFTLQMALRRSFLNADYKVAQIGTEHHSELLGMDFAFPMGYGSTLKMPQQSYVPFLDFKMREINHHKQPEIIITGSQSGTIPYDVYDHNTHSLSSLAFLLGVKPDACVLVVNSIDTDDYIQDTLNGIRAISKAPTLALAIGDKEKHVRTAYGRSLVTTSELSQEKINSHLKRLTESFNLPAIQILSERDQERLFKIIVDYFAK